MDAAFAAMPWITPAVRATLADPALQDVQRQTIYTAAKQGPLYFRNALSFAAGNFIYYEATKKIQAEVSTGSALTVAMTNTNVFPSMVLQMVAIGEESGALDQMLSKVADFFEQEVDEAVDSLSSLMEPMIMVVLGGLIGGIVVAMYLPIFKMGQAI